MKKAVLLIAAITIVAVGVTFLSSTDNVEKQPATIKQGLSGQVTLLTGDCQPGANSCNEKPVSRKIYIRELITANGIGGEYTDTNLVKVIRSASNGFYRTELLPGVYSVLVEDEGAEYCNSYSSGGQVCQVNVREGITKYDIEIDHAAS